MCQLEGARPQHLLGRAGQHTPMGAGSERQGAERRAGQTSVIHV